jgi:hypothetical protein
MKTVILELLDNSRAEVNYTPIPLIMEDVAANLINQLICDCMATAMYRCMEHIPLDRGGLAKVRLAEYGFSKAEIETSIRKLENE